MEGTENILNDPMKYKYYGKPIFPQLLWSFSSQLRELENKISCSVGNMKERGASTLSSIPAIKTEIPGGSGVSGHNIAGWHYWL